MHLELNLGEMTPREAASVMAMIMVLYPDAINEMNTGTEKAITALRNPFHAHTPQSDRDAIDRGIAAHAVFDVADEPTPETAFAPDPATAFGAIPTPPVAEPADAPAPPPAASATAVELDKDGLPWDARIHSGNKAKVADGSWRKRKGVGADMIASVTTELKGLMAVPGPTPAAPPPPVVEQEGRQDAVIEEVAPPPPPAPPAAEAAPTMAAGLGVVPTSFPALMQKVTGAIQAEQVTMETEIAAILADMKLKSLRDFVSRPDLIAAFNDQLDAYIASA